MQKMNSLEWQEARNKIYKRDLGICQYCGIELKDKFHIDHIVPVSKGGRDVLKNLALSCGRCNQKKHDMWVMEFAIYLEKRGFDLQDMFSVRLLRECGIEPKEWKIRELAELKNYRPSKTRITKKDIDIAMSYPWFVEWNEKLNSLTDACHEVYNLAHKLTHRETS